MKFGKLKSLVKKRNVFYKQSKKHAKSAARFFGPRAAIVGGSAVAGSIGYTDAAQPGLKFQASKEGFATGAAIGAATIASPFVARKAIKSMKVRFIRVRGRIIPVRGGKK